MSRRSPPPLPPRKVSRFLEGLSPRYSSPGQVPQSPRAPGDGVYHHSTASLRGLRSVQKFNTARIVVGTWNVGGVKEVNLNEECLRQWLDLPKTASSANTAEIYIIHFQEFRDLNQPINYLPHQVEKRLQRRMTERFGREEACQASLDRLLSTHRMMGFEKLVGLSTFVYISKDFLATHRLTYLAMGKIALGAFDVIGNKGAIFICLKIDAKKICVVNVHLTAGKGKDKFDSRMKQLATILQHVSSTPGTPLLSSNTPPLNPSIAFGAVSVPAGPGVADLVPERHVKRALSYEASGTRDLHHQHDEEWGRRKSRSKEREKVKNWNDVLDYLILAGDFNFRGIRNIPDKKRPSIRRSFMARHTKKTTEVACSEAAAACCSSLDPPSSVHEDHGSSKRTDSYDGVGPDEDGDFRIVNPMELWAMDELKQAAILYPDNPILPFVEAHEIKPKRVGTPFFPAVEKNINEMPHRRRRAHRRSPPFPLPTYKYVPNRGVFAPKRVPAWTDRVLVGMGNSRRTNDDQLPPVSAMLHCAEYRSLPTILQSDHLPVISKFNLFTYGGND